MTDDKRLWPIYRGDEIDTLADPTWLVDGHLTDGLTVVYGPSGSGKTFLALAWALALATGMEWHGSAVKHTPVVYVSGEGQSGIRKRRRAWMQHNDARDTDWFALIPDAVAMLDPDHVAALEADVVANHAGLLVIDTLARSMRGGDENSSGDVGAFIAGCDRIRQRGCAVVLVHHSGHEGGRERGSSALRAAADTSVEVAGDDKYVNVICRKQKDAAPFPRSSWALREVAGSCVLAPSLVPPKRRVDSNGPEDVM